MEIDLSELLIGTTWAVALDIHNTNSFVALEWTFLQEYSVNAVLPQGSIILFALALLCINDLPDDVICNIATIDTTFFSEVWSGV